MEMKKYKLGDLGKIVTGKTPRTSIEENYGGDIPFITPSNDLSVKDIREVSKKITELGLKEVKNCLLPPRSICVSCIGSDMGKVVMTSVPSVTNQQFNSIIPNESFDADYIYYLMIPIGQQMKNKLGKQSTAVPIVSKSQFSDIDVSIICDIKDQKKVSSVLSSIDNRIENLRAQNRVLEQTAKTIYDYTFLQCAGHQTTYNKTLNRNIPADWEVKKMEEVLQPTERGISYSSEEIKSGKGMPMYNLACFDKQGNYRSGELKFYSGEYKTSDLIKLGDMLIACTDLTRNADIIGTPVIVNDEYDLSVYTTDLAKITPKNEEMKYHIYFWLKNSSYRKYIKPFASGTNVLHLNVRGVLDYPILVPNSSVLKKFNAQVEPIFRKQLVNAKQIETLITQRNTLLPLLMTGQVVVG